jgi:hypothetical protein
MELLTMPKKPQAIIFRCFAIAAAVLLISCENASFEGNNAKKDPSSAASQDLKGTAHRPEGFSDNQTESGWIAPGAFEDLQSDFDGDFVNADAKSGKDDSSTLGDDTANSDDQSNGRPSDDLLNGGQGSASGKIGIHTDKNGSPKLARNSSFVYWQPCDKTREATRANTAYRGPKGATVRVAGGFCPKGSAVLNLLFVVDFSGSMVDGFGQRGNDPIVGNSCGRLLAIKKVIKKIKDEIPENTRVKAGLIGFSNTASERLSIQRLENLEENLSVANVCGADDIGARTNYEAAFNAARTALAEFKEGDKVIYFISDGEPTIPINQVVGESAGREAARALRNAVDDLTLNAIYLGNVKDEQKARNNLEDITSDPKRVVLVRDARDLTEAATGLTLPELGMKRSSLSGFHNHPAGRFGVGIDKFALGKKSRQWIFITDPITLEGQTGSTVNNQVEVLATTDDGEQLRATVSIGFSQVE